MIYLAVPYSHPDPEVREQRFKLANKIAGGLLKCGMDVYSPISHCHPIAIATGLGLGWETWQNLDCKFMDICETMLVIKSLGWEQSKGIKHEIAYMRKQGKTITYVDPNDYNKG